MFCLKAPIIPCSKHCIS